MNSTTTHKPPTLPPLPPANCSEAEAYQAGWKSGRSATGQFNENPYKHRLSKLRKAWHAGWMARGAIYIEETQPPNVKVSDAPDSAAPNRE